MRLKPKQIILAIVLFLVFLPLHLHAVTYEMKAAVAMTGVANQADQMFLKSDNRYLYFTSGGDVYVADLGYFDLAATQPYDLALDTNIDYSVIGVTLSSSAMYGTQETKGYLLTYNLSDITAKPTNTIMQADTDLGKVAITRDGTKLYMVDTDNKRILVHTIGSTSAATPIALSYTPYVTSFNILDMILVQNVSGGKDYVYVSTDKGILFYIVDGTTTASVVVLDSTYTHDLPSMSADATNQYLYVVDSDANALSVRSWSSPATESFSVEFTVGSTNYNQDLLSVISTALTESYTFTSGKTGVSITENQTFRNPDGTSGTTPIDASSNKGPMVASSDGYVYMSNGGGNLVVITANPWVDITDVTYSSGSSLTVGESVTFTFTSDLDGTWTFMSGGSVDRSGTLLTDSTGATSGDIVADVPEVVTINYDDNSSAFDEGDNDVFIFVQDDALTTSYGRMAYNVEVQAPPPAVTVHSTNFGNTRMYITMDRLTVSDMSYYNIYVSNDPDAVLDPPSVTPVQLAQPTSGSTFTAEIDGLTNGTLYYASVRGVDTSLLEGPLTTTLADGTTRISATPQETFGPLSGEKGCSLVKNGGNGMMNILMLTLLTAGLVIARSILLSFRRTPESRELSGSRLPPSFTFKGWWAGEGRDDKRTISLLVVLALLLFSIPRSLHAEEASPQWWSTELKGGFWMPTGKVMKEYFSPCCHMTGQIQQGFLYKSKLGAEVGVAFLSENGKARTAAGAVSGDTFNLFLLPMETNVAFHADFKEDQLLVPYVKGGIDYVYFRQNLKGTKTTGMKYGMHGVLGVQILLDKIDSNMKMTMEQDYKINDVYFTLEGKYSWINNFGSKSGVNLSNVTCSFGLLFQY